WAAGRRARRSSPLVCVVVAAIAPALLELAHHLDPLGEFAQIGACATAALGRPGACIRVVGSLIVLESEPVLNALHLEHQPLLVSRRGSPLDHGVSPVIVHYRADTAPLGRRRCILR